MFRREAKLSDEEIINQLNSSENARKISQETKIEAYRLADIIRVPRDSNKFDLYIINRHEIIGTGSHSEIVKAYPFTIENDVVKMSEKPVVVKHIRPIHENASEDDIKNRAQVIEGLQRESKTFKALGKPLGDHVPSPNGDYLMMPLVDGEKLAIGVERSAVLENASPTQKAKILYQLSHQVKQMHDKQIMHGDLHPENIMVKLEGDKIDLQLIDFDQSQKISNKRSVITQSEAVRMADQIAPPEVSKKQVGAPSDIYALGLNYLFILGHPNPYAPVKDEKKLKSDAKAEFMETSEYKKAMRKLKNSDKYKHLSVTAQEVEVKTLRMELVKEKEELYSEDNLNRIYQQQKPVLEIGELKSIPLEVDGIKLREEVQKFLQRMVSDKPEDRPTIDQVNFFMQRVDHLVERSENKKNNEEKVVISPDDQSQHSLYQEKLAVLLENMKDISHKIDKEKGFSLDRLAKKNPKRAELEEDIKGFAKLFSKDSPNPEHDYATVCNYLNDKVAGLAQEKRSKEVSAISSIIVKGAEAKLEAEKSLTKSTSSTKSRLGFSSSFIR